MALKSRGFVITLDAIAALSFMLLSLYFIQTTSFNPTILKGTQLKDFSLDTLTVLEKSGRLGDLITGDSTAVREVLLASPDPDCMQFTLSYLNDTQIAVIDKPGCGGIGNEVQVDYGLYDYGGQVYKTTLKSWYNVEVG